MRSFDFFSKKGTNKKTNDLKNYTEDKIPVQSTAFGDEEFSAEIYSQGFDTQTIPSYNSYSYNDVQLSHQPNTMKLTYTGILAQNGAKDIYAVIGYGNNLKWENVSQNHMHKNANNSFEMIFPIERSGNINIAFKDNADNWDNNSGMNYTFENQIFKGSH